MSDQNWATKPLIVPYPVTLAISTLLGYHGRRSGSLSFSGSVAAAILGYVTLANPLRLFGVSLLVFYFAGSRITKVASAYKATLEAPEHPQPPPDPSGKKQGAGNRSAAQVCCNALVGALCALTWRTLYSGEAGSELVDARSWGHTAAGREWCAIEKGTWSRALVVAAVAFWAACSGDTLGVLSQGPPILLTTLRAVPRGTNGAISAWGTHMSLLGGLLVGVAASASLSLENRACGQREVWETLVLVGAVDSVLGATLQETLYSPEQKLIVHTRPPPDDKKADKVVRLAGFPLLSNNGVNFVSSSLTAAAAFWWASR
ncbi:hypothetical protein T439DRAFT_355413 [Meredithblackwellia eburnea MCA 4105]